MGLVNAGRWSARFHEAETGIVSARCWTTSFLLLERGSPRFLLAAHNSYVSSIRSKGLHDIVVAALGQLIFLLRLLLVVLAGIARHTTYRERFLGRLYLVELRVVVLTGRGVRVHLLLGELAAVIEIDAAVCVLSEGPERVIQL